MSRQTLSNITEQPSGNRDKRRILHLRHKRVAQGLALPGSGLRRRMLERHHLDHRICRLHRIYFPLLLGCQVRTAKLNLFSRKIFRGRLLNIKQILGLCTIVALCSLADAVCYALACVAVPQQQEMFGRLMDDPMWVTDGHPPVFIGADKVKKFTTFHSPSTFSKLSDI